MVLTRSASKNRNNSAKPTMQRESSALSDSAIANVRANESPIEIEEAFGACALPSEPAEIEPVNVANIASASASFVHNNNRAHR